jgi:hypothetical protein
VNAATFSAQGTSLTVTSSNLQVSFSGADVVGIKNQLTGEQYLRNPSSNMQLNLTLVQAPSQVLAASGAWIVNAGISASLSFTDSNRTVSITVRVDPATQEVVVALDGRAPHGGVEQLMWGVTGFDLTAGKFILPSRGGLSLTGNSFSAQSQYYLSTGQSSLEAPLSLFQTAQGGVAVYSTDTLSLSKDMLLAANQQQTVNQLFEVEAPAPWPTATEAGPIEWRLAGYQGDWQTGARIYRDWHNTAMPPVPLTGGRAWANNIRTVVQIDSGEPFQNSVLDSLVSVLAPSKTLLYVVNWRAQGYDIDYPDYTAVPSAVAFVSYAHQLGFHVMLHTDMIGASPSNPDFAAIQQFQIRDPLTLQVQGWFWNLPASTPNRFAFMDLAASALRQLFIQRISPAIQTLHPDAIHLDASVSFNDGNGLIEGKNFNQGAVQLHRDLLAAFPNLVIGTEEINDMIAPWDSFSQPLIWGPGFNSSVTPPVPITAYVLANVAPYWHLGVPNPYEAGFLAELEQYEGQAVVPTYHVGCCPAYPDYTQPDMARYMKVVSAFQTNNLQPAWDTNWNGAVVSYAGANGASASLTDSGTLMQLVQQPAASLLYQRVHASNQINSTLHIPSWPAYNGNLTLGLDPADQYWLDAPANDSSLPHVTGLPAGAKLGLEMGTLVTPQFSYFQLFPATSQSFDFFAGLWQANVGVTFNGTDFPLGNGAVANLTTMLVGGVTREAIFTHPPYMAQRGGETFIEYTVPVPSGNGETVSFAAGILDAAIGQRQGPLTFKVEVSGTIFWQQNVSTGGWQAGSVDLSSFQGQTVKIRFVTNPGPSGNPDFAWGGWSALQLTVAGNDAINGVSLAVSQALTSSNVLVSGGTASVNNGIATINGLPPGGTVLVFSGSPTAVAGGQSLLNLPFTASQSSSGILAGPSQVPYVGTIGATTSGGITKQQTLWALSPSDGQTILSWYLQLPGSSSLALSFSGAYWDGSVPQPQGYLMSVRVNGTVLWQYDVNLPAAWAYGSVDLSPWSGRTVLLELITDSQGANYSPVTSWAELNFSAAGAGTCATSLSSPGPINAPAAGATGNISVTTASGCNWSAEGQADWITAGPSSAAGNGTANYTIAANLGPSRQATLTIAGHVLLVSQAAPTTPPAPVLASPVNGASGVSLSVSLNWNASMGATSYDIYFGTSPTPALVSNTTATTYSPGTLSSGTTYYWKVVAKNSAGSAGSAVWSFRSLTSGTSAIALSPAKLQFGYSGQLITGTQTVALNFNPSAAISWTASSNQSNITVSPASGTGSALLQITAAPGASGTITVTAAGATNSPQQIQVTLTSVSPAVPFGSFDTPVSNTTGIAGAIPVTGWALDSIQATNVGIWREAVTGETASPNGLVFIGNAIFVAGARPDVQATYPNAPFNYRAGWGYQLLTNFLPNASGSGASGNGTYKLHAIITNASGQTLDLGAHAITVDNVHASKPFGTIDTPAQGGTVSGNAYVNFGWALTQTPYVIPMDGSTITVILDGVAVGHPTYNQYRSDIANLFPGLANSNGAVGFFYIDTTTLANGVHTISWNVFDNAGRGDGIGSRYITVANTGGGNVPVSDEPLESSQITADATGVYSVSMEELGRIELPVGATGGYLLVNGERQALPVGSTLKGGRFYWQAGLGFLGDYDLMFERPDSTVIRVHVTVKPKAPSR